MIIWHQLTLSPICSAIWQDGRGENRNVHKSSKCTPPVKGDGGKKNNTFSVKKKNWLAIESQHTKTLNDVLNSPLHESGRYLADILGSCVGAGRKDYVMWVLYSVQLLAHLSLLTTKLRQLLCFHSGSCETGSLLVSLLYFDIVSIICSALGSLPSLVQTTAEIILALQHIVEDYCSLSLGHYTRSKPELAAHVT